MTSTTMTGRMKILTRTMKINDEHPALTDLPSLLGYVGEPVHRMHREPETSASHCLTFAKHRPSFGVRSVRQASHRSDWVHTAQPSGHGKHSPLKRKLPSAHAVHPICVISRKRVASAVRMHFW